MRGPALSVGRGPVCRPGTGCGGEGGGGGACYLSPCRYECKKVPEQIHPLSFALSPGTTAKPRVACCDYSFFGDLFSRPTNNFKIRRLIRLSATAFRMPAHEFRSLPSHAAPLHDSGRPNSEYLNIRFVTRHFLVAVMHQVIYCTALESGIHR